MTSIKGKKKKGKERECVDLHVSWFLSSFCFIICHGNRCTLAGRAR